MEPVQRRAPKKKAPPPGHPILTGFTEDKRKELEAATQAIRGHLEVIGDNPAPIARNGGTGPSAGDQAKISRTMMLVRRHMGLK